ncbi:MAG TPA: FAD-binding protein [Actinotalea sp.]
MTTLSALPPATTPAGSVPAELVDRLRATIEGTVLAAGEPRYVDLVTPWNVAVTMAPAVVVAARTAADVAATVRLAGEHGLTVGVQSRGHGALAALAGDVLVTTRDLDELELHADERWVRFGAGLRGADVVAAATPHGLLPLLGSSTDVGVVGLLTGGGVGPLARTYGLSADRLRAIEVVTGDGTLRRVTPDDDADLFAALRGGKGAAGIVTTVELDLLPLTSFYGGALYFDGADAAAVLHGWRAWSADLPEEATTSVAILQLPDAPFVPPPLAGRLSVSLRFAWTGDPGVGARYLEPVRGLGRLLLDDVADKPVAALDSVHADPVDPLPGLDAATLLRELPAEAVDTVLALAGPGSHSPQLIVELRRLGGALGRPGRHRSAFVHRAAEYSVFSVGIAMDPRVAGHGAAFVSAMEPWSTGGVWPNYGTAYDATSARRAYDQPTLDLLAAVVDRVDPAGVLVGGAPFRTLTGDPARP